jgi:hypothetical protein
MRLSDICFHPTCTEPHFRRFSHIVDGHRRDFCCETHYMADIQATRARQLLRRRDLENREWGARL